jgi:hypothetical protein
MRNKDTILLENAYEEVLNQNNNNTRYYLEIYIPNSENILEIKHRIYKAIGSSPEIQKIDPNELIQLHDHENSLRDEESSILKILVSVVTKIDGMHVDLDENKIRKALKNTIHNIDPNLEFSFERIS